MIKALMLALAFAAGAIESPLHAQPADAGKPQATHRVDVTEFKFVPQTLRVRIGDTVVFTNKDLVPHTATVENGWDSGALANGQSWTLNADKAGSFDYGCIFHPAMTATLIVE